MGFRKVLQERRIVLDVGHSENDKGAYSRFLGVSEFDYNNDVANIIVKKWDDKRATLLKNIRRDYMSLPDDLNVLDPYLIVSLHCNSFRDESANGTECLYFHKSSMGVKIANEFVSSFSKIGFRNRGPKPVKLGDRGHYQLRHTKATNVIVEPGFFSNEKDCAILEDKELIADTYIKTIKRLLDGKL